MQVSVGVLSSGVGNIGSVMNMLRYIGATPVLVTQPSDASGLSHLILPGVGSFDAGMTGLRSSGLDECVNDHTTAGRPLLGICLGMQLLLEGSDEGSLPGLGLLPGRCHSFAGRVGSFRVPQMGWNEVTPTAAAADGPGLPDGGRFYFAHSYYLPLDEPTVSYGQTVYGVRYSSVIGQGPVVGMQFHPEKSHRYGVSVLTAFLGWQP